MEYASEGSGGVRLPERIPDWQVVERPVADAERDHESDPAGDGTAEPATVRVLVASLSFAASPPAELACAMAYLRGAIDAVTRHGGEVACELRYTSWGECGRWVEGLDVYRVHTSPRGGR